MNTRFPSATFSRWSNAAFVFVGSWGLLWSGLIGSGLHPSVALAWQTTPAETAPASEETGTPAEPAHLTDRQMQLAEEYFQLESVMLRMADLIAREDPVQGEVLRKAVAEGRSHLVGQQLEEAARLLREEQLGDAVRGQQKAATDLELLLNLLLSANNDQGEKDRKQQLKDQIKQLKKLIEQQGNLRNRTEISENLQPLADEQGLLERAAQELSEGMDQNSSGKPSGEPSPGNTEEQPNPAEQEAPGQSEQPNADNADEPGDQPGEEPNPEEAGEPSKPDTLPTGEGENANPPQPGESPPSGENPAQEGQPQPGEPQPGQQGESQQGEPQEGQPPNSNGQPMPQPGQPSPGQNPSDQQTPGQEQSPEQSPATERIKAAQARMKEAQEKLKSAEREGSVEKQTEALRELERAKDALEEILRQMREEEIGRTLAALEARFQRMLELQLLVNETTLILDEQPLEARTREHEIEAGRLARKEGQIIQEADKALQLMQEDASAVVFPEAVEQLRQDMVRVQELLQAAAVGDETQLIEQEIVSMLEEMIESLEQAQQEQQERERQPPQPQEPTEPPLVDQLAELRLIRLLQVRVNRRTEFYKERFLNQDEEQVESPEVVRQLQELAGRQERIFQAMQDLARGKGE